jgi:hypothetical protein
LERYVRFGFGRRGRADEESYKIRLHGQFSGRKKCDVSVTHVTVFGCFLEGRQDFACVHKALIVKGSAGFRAGKGLGLKLLKPDLGSSAART